MRKVIVNTTPIIALADIGHLDLLQKLYTEIIIPEAVHAEILSEPARSQVSAVDWIKVQKVANANTKSLFSARLFVQKTLLERVPDELLWPQAMEELFERDYNTIREEIEEYRRSK